MDATPVSLSKYNLLTSPMGRKNHSETVAQEASEPIASSSIDGISDGSGLSSSSPEMTELSSRSPQRLNRTPYSSFGKRNRSSLTIESVGGGITPNSGEQQDENIVWIDRDVSETQTPLTVPHHHRLRKEPLSLYHITCEPLRFSDEVQTTPLSQVAPLAADDRIDSQRNESRTSLSIGQRSPSPFSVLMSQNEFTATKEVILKPGCELPSPCSPLWNVDPEDGASSCNSDQQVHQDKPEMVLDGPSITKELSEENGLPIRILFNRESGNQTSIMSQLDCFFSAPSSQLPQVEENDGFSVTQTCEELDSGLHSVTSKLCIHRQTSAAHQMDEYVRATNNFFSQIDSRPLLVISCDKNSRLRRQDNISKMAASFVTSRAGLSKGKGNPSSFKFEQVVARAKKAKRALEK